MPYNRVLLGYSYYTVFTKCQLGAKQGSVIEASQQQGEIGTTSTPTQSEEK